MYITHHVKQRMRERSGEKRAFVRETIETLRRLDYKRFELTTSTMWLVRLDEHMIIGKGRAVLTVMRNREAKKYNEFKNLTKEVLCI